jgi:hypothetical protein
MNSHEENKIRYKFTTIIVKWVFIYLFFYRLSFPPNGWKNFPNSVYKNPRISFLIVRTVGKTFIKKACTSYMSYNLLKKHVSLTFKS